MTPLQLRVMIQAYTTTSWQGLEEFKNNKVWIDQTFHLVDEGLIEISKMRPQGDTVFPYVTTLKGTFWLEHVLSIPYPVAKFEIPEIK